MVGISFKGNRRSTGGYYDTWLPNDGLVDDEKENGLNDGGAVIFVLKHETATTAPEKAQTSCNYCSATGQLLDRIKDRNSSSLLCYDMAFPSKESCKRTEPHSNQNSLYHGSSNLIIDSIITACSDLLHELMSII